MKIFYEIEKIYDLDENQRDKIRTSKKNTEKGGGRDRQRHKKPEHLETDEMKQTRKRYRLSQ